MNFQELDLTFQDRLSLLNQARFVPGLPGSAWRDELERKHRLELVEVEWLEQRRAEIQPRAASAPRDAAGFVRWFEDLEATGPGQGDPLHSWLAETADREQMRWFIAQEVAGEAGFDDLVAMAQLKLSPRPKLEMARNYWDEMGRGAEKGMHGPMLERVALELEISPRAESILPEPLNLSNIMAGLAHHRRYAFHAIGALGAIELTAPKRAEKTYRGLKRLGLSPAATQYFLIHSTLDVKHSIAWNQEVLGPIVAERPEAAQALAEGALMRLEAGRMCFEAYRKRLQLRF